MRTKRVLKPEDRVNKLTSNIKKLTKKQIEYIKRLLAGEEKREIRESMQLSITDTCNWETQPLFFAKILQELPVVLLLKLIDLAYHAKNQQVQLLSIREIFDRIGITPEYYHSKFSKSDDKNMQQIDPLSAALMSLAFAEKKPVEKSVENVEKVDDNKKEGGADG